MLESSWEVYATTLANAASSDALITALDKLVQDLGIDTAVPANVVYAYDTRPSGPVLVASLEDGFKAIGANARKGGVTTTPVLHYLVRTINTKGSPEAYGDDSEDAYYSKLANAYKKLVVCRCEVTVYNLESYAGSMVFLLVHQSSSTAPTALVHSLRPTLRNI
jgi:phosphoacetylglucosamine mutase